MLNSISIQNIALISDVTINLNNGLNVLTGETGAGKSLVIDSISLLLGDKADRTLISYDKDFAYIEAVFFTNNNHILDLMESLGLPRENTIVVSRKLSKDGKNECRVNGKVFTLSMLKKLTSPLMDLHGQFEHQSILDNNNQLEIIDNLGGQELLQVKNKFADKFVTLQDINKQLYSFTEDDNERNRLLDLYDYQINEITEANFKQGEEEQLKEYRQKVLNIEKISSALNNSVSLAENGLNGGGSIAETFAKLLSLISTIKNYSSQFEELYNRIDSLKIDALDVVDCIKENYDNLDFNQEEAMLNEARLDLLSSFKKKYGKNIEEINNYLKKISDESERLKNAEEYIQKLKTQKQMLTKELTKIGQELSDKRKASANILQQKIGKELSDLAMNNTTFTVQFTQKDIDDATIMGLDQVEYMFSANAGQPPKPLNKIISGGEMSRFMLAVKNITADVENIDTMIFDEIDTGVSGNSGEMLAKKLLTIGKSRQVICVSHLPQVASYANYQYYISKKTLDNKTITQITQLSYNDRINEISRLIGGSTSQHSLKHAQFMMDNAAEFLKTLN